MEKTIVPPYSNTGVREYINNINEYQFGTFHPEEKISYSIDWLRVTTGKIEYSKTQEPSINGILKINKLLKLLKTDYDFYSLKIENYGINGYRYKMTVCDGIKLYFYGPCNKLGEFTTLIEITGTGCDRFRSSIDWYNLIKFYIEELKVNCTRIDMAVDDFYGENITYKEFFNIVNKEFYKRCGTPKSKPVWYTESLNNYDDGCTVNFYSPTSNVQLVSYNKQAEQKAKKNPISDSPQWLRHELRFNNDQAVNQLNVFYQCLCLELLGEITEDSTNFSKYISSALYEALKLYEPTTDTNKSRWVEHPGWLKFIGDIKGIKFKRSKTKNERILKTKVYFEENYSKFLLKMYLVFGEEFLLLWIKDLMFNNRKKLEPEDYVAVNELRHALDMNLLKINEMIIKAASTQIYKTDDLEILNQYYTPGKQDFIDKELGKFVDDEKSKLIDVNLEIEEQILNIKDKIEKLKILLGE